MNLMPRGCRADRLWVLVIFFIYLGAANFATAQEAGNVCTTKECNDTAHHILQYMNTNISPCTNFYQFVCGEFDSDGMTFIVGYDYSVKSDYGDNVGTMMAYYLETKTEEEKNKPFRQAFDLFNACIDQDALKDQGIDPLKEIIDKLGGWPLVEGDQWKETKWEEVTRTLTELGYDSSIFFEVSVTQVLGPTIQTAPARIKEFYSRAWNKIMVVATKLGADPDTLPPPESKNHLHNFDNPSITHSTGYMTIAQMNTRWPSIDWMTYFSGVFAAVPDVTVEEDQGVMLCPEYIDELVQMLNITHPAFIMNYVIAKVVDYSLQYLSPDVPSDPRKGVVNVQQSPTERRARCAYIVSDNLPLMYEAIYEVNYVDCHLKNTIMNLSTELKGQLGELINGAEWLDSVSKDLSLDKLHQMDFSVGFPEDIKNGDYTDPYIGLEIDRNSYLHSMLNCNRFKTTKKYEKSIANDYTAPAYKMKITSSNAQYNNDLNEMNIMPGILQDPNFNDKVPMYINYGGIGFVLGHEATHGFDMEEKVFTASSPDSSEEASREKFRAEENCISKQFADYVSETWQLEIDGHKFSRENIADRGGVKVAFNAYEKWGEENGVEPSLPDLNYNPLQMYWIALAHTECAKYNPSMISQLLDVDTHGLHEFRINGPFSNNPDFAKTFNCPLGSPMNPEEKCFVW